MLNTRNQQNIPVRDQKAKDVCRGGLLPSPGNKILEADYGGIEVRIGGCVHLDPNMIDYINDDSTDMHRDTSADLWFLKTSEVTKQIRQSAKGNWVFPQFYGSWYKECAANLWEECIVGGMVLDSGVSLKDHMKAHKITTLAKFVDHCKNVEKIFWGTRFKGYAKWKVDINKHYQQTGSIYNPFGFKFQGYMRENDSTNYPIQSTAFHCLLWSLNRINRYFYEKDLKSKIIGQIHDSIVVDLVPSEQIEVMSIINHVGTTLLEETFDWIIVPMIIEFEITGVDKPWSKKKEVELNAHHAMFTAKHLVGNEELYMDDINIWE